MANKIKYGLSNVHAFPIESVDASGAPTYGAAIPVPGAVTLTMDPDQTTEPFYADDVVYYMVSTNNGYEGSLEIALVPEAFRVEVMGDLVDDAGVAVESADGQTKEFALSFEFKGDSEKTRYILYRVAAARPSVSGSTRTNASTPQTETLDMTAMPRINDKLVKAYASETSAAYATWNTAPYEPVFTEP